MIAAGALVDYITLTQKGKLPRLEKPQRLTDGAVMEIDAATRRNLELTRTMEGERRGSLLATIDHTRTGAGARLLSQWISAPLTDVAAISQRLDAVGFFVENAAVRTSLGTLLKRCPDVERALSRLSLGRGGPRDLASVRDTLTEVPELCCTLRGASASLPPLLEGLCKNLGTHHALTETLTEALGPDLPLLARDGGFIAPGWNAGLDELRTLRDQSRRLMVDLQNTYAHKTSVESLKIKHNNVLGYFVEVPTKRADVLLQQTDLFIHRQTMSNAVRFCTVELSDLENQIRGAGDKALALESELFQTLVDRVLQNSDAIAKAGVALATLDVLSGLAELADTHRYARPQMTDTPSLSIQEGRHPVVEPSLAASENSAFVPNSCALSDEQRLWLITGPNMAGKSTFLRQNALIVILAQMGSFVPATCAEIGIVDRLFSRVGAADDLARGRSTFMVEMVETAAILNQATPHSLVILDEIGRGTATFDGLSIAWATVEHIHNTNQCRALFATHYHELTTLADQLRHVACYSLAVKDWDGRIIFLHEIKAGAADRSYGIHVARLAGLPEPVIRRAQDILRLLESGDTGQKARDVLMQDLPLFSTRPPSPRDEEQQQHTQLIQALQDVNPDGLTPRQALEKLYFLTELLYPDRSMF